MRKNLKYAADGLASGQSDSDPVWGVQATKTGASRQSPPIVRDDNRERREERGNMLSKEIGVSDVDERPVGEKTFHSFDDKTVETIGQVHIKLHLVNELSISTTIACRKPMRSLPQENLQNLFSRKLLNTKKFWWI